MNFLCLNDGKCRIPLTNDQITDILKTVRPQKRLCEVGNDEVFEIAGIKFFKASDFFGQSTIVAKDSVFQSKFGKNNNFAESEILKRLQREILPELKKAVGCDRYVYDVSIKLSALDGSQEYDNVISEIGIPSLEFYQQYIEIFDKHGLDEYWWLATPWATPKRGYDKNVLCVTPQGDIDDYYCDDGSGVRPFCILSSSIFVSVVNE